jgi:hypothetical protein
MTEPQNEGEPWQWHIEETFKSIFQFAIEALKALLLINGGAAVAILAYLGSLNSHDPKAHVPHMKSALLCWRRFLDRPRVSHRLRDTVSPLRGRARAPHESTF